MGLRSSGTITSGSTDDIRAQGLYTLNADVTNKPLSGTCQMAVLGVFGDSRRLQMIWDAGGIRMAYRQTTWDGIWSNWSEVTTNLPAFYKNYNNLASLVQGVCGLTMININLDNVISIDKVGCYITTSTCTNAPTTGTFYIISLPSNLTDEWFLIAFNLAGSHLYVGFTRTSLTSMAWRTIV